MMEYSLLDLASMVVYAFGALTFSLLTVFYWRERRPKRSIFHVFTLVCAGAFLSNLLFRVLPLHLPFPTMLTAAIIAGMIPPLILHVVYEAEGIASPVWRWPLAALYACSMAASVLREMHIASEYLYRAPAIALGVSTASGLLAQIFSRRTRTPRESAHRTALRVLLALMLACAAASLAGLGAFLFDAPDYLLLAFFAVSLYYRERLVFFDLLVKRCVFLAVGLAILGVAFTLRERAGANPWILALGLPLFWLAGPSVYDLVARAIDRAWLRRPYSSAEAERQFIREIQAAVTEDDLRARAESSLRAIFQAPATVFCDGNAAAVADGLAAEFIQLGPRPNGIPFLSDDRRLLQSLANALAVVLENVRFRVERRRQEEREQQLRWLASRAELKALRAQINPHFLFNSLSVIAGLVHYRPEKADEAIEELAQVFRYTLRKSEHEWAPLAEEIDFVSAYLRIEQARFGDRLQVAFAVDPATAGLAIPAMSVQPLVENAIKHGISAVEGPGTVGLRAAMDEGRLRLEVSDSGPGFPAGFSLEKNGEGHGLRNVMERLRGYYGDAARLSWDNGDGATRVVLELPAGDKARDTHFNRG
ncbi:MAG TPA: histidine kinase [Bryobacteraceae bacterium]|nr:histidine kinase [Bryobacteraceae bacterium]